MDLLIKFKSYLEGKENPASKFTVKNYIADTRKFINWYETRYERAFIPTNITPQLVEEFKKDKAEGVSARSIDRYLSALRLFFNFAKLEGFTPSSPFSCEAGSGSAREQADPYHLRDFKNNLYVFNASHLTIKNYIIDVKQFFKWAEEVTGVKDAWEVKDKNLFNWLDSGVVEEYKQRLIESGFAPLSINRKLSSLRRYLGWAESEGLVSSIKNKVSSIAPEKKIQPDNFNALLNQQQTEESDTKYQIPNTKYSAIPPIRLGQKVSRGIGLFFDAALIAPLTKTVQQGQYLAWKIKGKPVFQQVSGISNLVSGSKILNTKYQILTPNLKKVSYAPLTVSTRYFPWYKRLWHHARHTRPNWYKQYHSYSVTHYFHLAILMIFMSALGFGFYQNFVVDPKSKGPALAAAVSPLKILSFQGRLTDASDNPITAAKWIRVVIYNDSSASGAARLWEEVEKVTPDTDGIFSILMGDNGSGANAALCNSGDPPTSPPAGACGIPQSLFANNAALYLGVTVEADPELTPRQQLATVAYATNAETLQGLPPITDASVTTNANAVLALNSSGQVSISGTATTVFQSTGGQLTVTGKTLLLNSASGTGTNIQLVPDGLGKVDIQKPILNSTNNSNITTAQGGVEVDDIFAVLATSSAQSAFTVNQDSTGPLISASTSGTAKFTVDNSGNTTLAGNAILSTDDSYIGLGASAGRFVFDATPNPDEIDVQNATLDLNSNLITNIGNTATDFDSSGGLTLAATLSVQGNTIGLNNDADANNLIGVAAAGGIANSDLFWGNDLVCDVSETNCGWATGSGSSNWQRTLGALAPLNITDDLLIGGTASSSAKFQVFGVGTYAGTASSSGSLTFNDAVGTNPSINVFNSNRLDIKTSVGGDGGLGAVVSILNNGNVGIGTTNPGATLSVGANSASAGIIGIPNNVWINARNAANSGDVNMMTVNGSNQLELIGRGIGMDTSSNIWRAPDLTGAVAIIGGWDTSNAALMYVYGGSHASRPGGVQIIVPNAAGNAQVEVVRITGRNDVANVSFLNSNVGIGTTAPVGALEVNKNQVGKALAIFDQDSDQDIIAASASGVAKFTVSNGGNLTTAGSVILSTDDSYVGLGASAARFVFDSTPTPDEIDVQNATLDLNSNLITNIGNTATDFDSSGGLTLAATLSVQGNTIGLNNDADANNLIGVAAAGGIANSDLFWGNDLVCDVSETNCGWATTASGTNVWQRNNGALSPLNITDDLIIGGTASSSAKFQVFGVGTYAGTASSSGSLTFNDAVGTNPSINVFNSNRLDIKTSVGGDAGLGAVMSILNNGNVGIGTTGPGKLLDVAGQMITSDYAYFGGTVSTGLRLKGADNENTIYQNSGNLSITATTGNKIFLSLVSAPTTGLTVDTTTGNVGIGTTGPIGKLHVDGTNIGKALAIFNETGTNDIITASASGVTKLRVLNTGSVHAAAYYDIDNTSYFLDPAATGTALNLVGTASTSANLTFQGAGTAHVVKILDGGSLDFQRSVGGDTGASTSTSTLFIKNDGNIGIGTTSPAGILDVATASNNYLFGSGATSGQNPELRVYGYDTGVSASKYGLLTIGTSGYFQVSSPAGETLDLNSDTRLNLSTGGLLYLGDNSTGTSMSWYGAGGVGLFQGSTTGKNPYLTIYGYDTGTASVQYSRLNTNAAGDLSIDVQSGNVLIPNGNVGIGTTNPLEVLGVTGNATISGTLAVNTIKPPTGALNLQYKSGANAWTNAITILDNSGNIGIGTTNPITLFEVVGADAIAKIWDNSGTRLPTLELRVYETQWGARFQGWDYGDGMGINFDTSDSADTWGTGMVLRHGGGTRKLGINNTTPLTALDVTGSASLSANLSLRGAGTTHTLNVLDGGRLDFQTSVGGDAGLAAKMTLSNNGNVGIGTTGPLYAFDILKANPQIILSDVATNNTGKYGGIANRQYASDAEPEGFSVINGISDSADTNRVILGGGFGETNAATRIDFFTAANATTRTGTERMRIESDGNVGIGDASPDYLLELYDATNTPAFALSDDDIGHGVTTLAQTDVFAHLSSISTTVGGLQVTGLADATGIALGLKGVQSSDPTDTTPAISLIGTKASGTGVQDLTDAETVLQIANNDNTAALTVLGNGNVGIGTVSPSEKLEIAGNIELSGLINSNNTYANLSSNYGLGLRNLANGTAANTQEIILDESATNLIKNPRPATSGTTNWDCWIAAETCSVTNITDSTMPGVGGHAIQVANTGASSHNLSERTNSTDKTSITSGQSYTVSFYAKSSTNRTVEVWLQRGSSPWDNITNTVNVSLTTSWQKFVVALVATATDNAQLNFDSNPTEASGTFAIANVLMENRAYATSYFDGAMGAGYAWTGTAHNSTSTRGAGTYIGTVASKIAFIDNTASLLNIAGDASSSGSLVFRGTSPATIDILNGDRLDFQTSVGGDGGLAAKMTLSNGGNLGIGTTAPAYMLTVNDNSLTYATDVLQNNADGWGSYIWVNNADTDKDALHVDNSAGAIFALTNAGNLGIGDAGPDYLLELNDATNTPTFALSDDDVLHGVTTLANTDSFFHLSSISTTVGGAQITGLADATGIALGLKGVQSSDPTDTTPAISLIGTKASGTGVQDLAATETVLSIANNDNAAALTILGNGNVGIGTTTPAQKLDVNGTITATDITCSDCLGQGDIGASAIGQGELKTTLAAEQSAAYDCTVAFSSTTSNVDLGGASYGFYPQIKRSSTCSKATTREIHIATGATNTTYQPNIYFYINFNNTAGTGTETIYAQQRYIQASPPYYIDGHFVKWFIYFLWDKNKNFKKLGWSAEDPPYENIEGENFESHPHPFQDYYSKPLPAGQEIAIIDSTDVYDWIAAAKAKNKSLLQYINEEMDVDPTDITPPINPTTGQPIRLPAPLVWRKLKPASNPITAPQVNQDIIETDNQKGDLAELFPIGGAPFMAPGDIVDIHPKSQTDQNFVLTKTESSYSSKMAGVISTSPTLIANNKYESNEPSIPLALSGRVPVNVSLIKGGIMPGDTITSSDIPGLGMKATRAGPTVGKAVTGFDGQNATHFAHKNNNSWEITESPCVNNEICYPVGKVDILVANSWYDPDVYLTDTGDLVIQRLASSELASSSGEIDASSSGALALKGLAFQSYTLLSTVKGVISRVGAFGEAAIANLRAGLITAQEISTDSLKIATDNVSIGGVTLKDYIAGVVSEALNNGTMQQLNNGKFISPIAEVDQIHTNVISPLASNSVTIHLGGVHSATSQVDASDSGKFIIENASGSAVATIDSAGNASFSGKLTADSLQTTEATIAGTLRAKNIIADSIEGLDQRIASSKLASSSANPNYTLDASQLNAINIASFSSQLAYVENLNTSTLAVNQGLMVFGPASLSDASVVNQLSIGGNLILADNSINVLGGTLEIQPLKQGAISLMGGMVQIDTEGNLTALGNVSVKGILSANIISPIPDSDLVIRLGNQESGIMNNGQNHNSSFVIHNSSNSAVLTINQMGDLVSSGSGMFSKLNLSPVSSALAISDTEVIATGSAGVATISAHLTELTIRNEAVTDNSLIYLTPVGLSGQNIFLMRQMPKESFTVGIPTLSENPTTFNWLIIN